jgi:hypothetical protein
VAVSTITQIMFEASAVGLAAFNRLGVLYSLWTTPGVFGLSALTLQWRPHTDATSLPVLAVLPGPYIHFTCAIRPSDGALLIAYDDSLALATADVWTVAFDPVTGAVLSQPMRIDTGSRPNIIVPKNGVAGQLHIVYVAADGSAVIRTSWNSGATWGDPQPVFNNKVRETTDLVTVPFDSGHVSVMQVGRDARPLTEIGAFTRTRPLAGILKHPTLDDRFFIMEAVQRQILGVNQFTDNLRDAMILLPGVTPTILLPDRVRLGTDDTVGELALLDTNYWFAAVVSSLVLTPGATPGADLVNVAIGPPLAQGATLATIFGAINAAVADVGMSAAYAYAVGYTDLGATGAFTVIRLSDQATAVAATGIPCHALGVGVIPTVGGAIIGVATLETGIERLRLYQENGLTPTLLATHKLPARANAVLVQMTSPTAGRVYVALSDRLLCYEINGLTSPIRLTLTIFILTRGTFQHLSLLPSGNILAALGNGGVGIFNTSGEILAQLLVSGVYAPTWLPGRTRALDDLAIPTTDNAYAPLRRYFKCTTGGVSGANEPPWAATGAVVDGTAQWTEQGVVDGVVANVAYDEKRQRLYAVGVANGPAGLVGKVWSIDAAIHLAPPPGYVAPPLKPNPPVGIQAITTPAALRSITVSWVHTPGTTGVRVFKSANVGGPFVQVYELLTGDPGSYVDADPTNPNGGVFYYTVAIQTAGGWSDQSYVARGITALDPQPSVVDASTAGAWRLFQAPLNVTPDAYLTAPHDLTLQGGAGLVITGFFPAPNNNCLIIPGAVNDEARNGADDVIRAIAQGVCTIEAWVNPNDTGARRAIFSVSHTDGTLAKEILTLYHAAGKLTASAGGVIIAQTLAALTAGVWQHVALRKTFVAGTTWKYEFFVNGVLQAGGGNIVGTPALAGQRLCVGNDLSSNHPLTGRANDVRFSSVARSDAEILATYNRGLGYW